MDVFLKLDECIKEVWKEDILEDYNSNFLLREDSLKNSFYYHLRVKLGDGFLKKNRIRIFTEYYLENNQRADLAIVKLSLEKEGLEKHLKDRVEELLAVIELKHKNSSCGYEVFLGDINKVKKHIKQGKQQNCLYYLGFIHETEYSIKEVSWLNKRQQESWAKEKLTELTAFREIESGNFNTYVVSYNGLNERLNYKV